MLFVDNRIGSEDLKDQLTKAGLQAEQTRLDFADVAFEGRGNNDRAIMVGIELKKLTARSTDLVDSLRSGRLAGHQLHGLTGENKIYDYSWLLIEGEWRIGRKGEILVPHRKTYRVVWEPARGNMTAVEMEKRVLTLDMCGGLRIKHTNNRPDTLRFIKTLYQWFTDVSMDRHTTHIVDHEPQGFLVLSDFRRAVQKFPDIGVRTSAAVEKHFAGSLRAACNAPAAEWADIVTYDKTGKPRRIGTKAGQNIEDFCRGVK